ncbi:MAG: hypothetical protein SGI98_09810 [Verrucomicrobiota bacterium]|nr:hypothetical protein [Verrucomicrobiota bacterium]
MKEKRVLMASIGLNVLLLVTVFILSISSNTFRGIFTADGQTASSQSGKGFVSDGDIKGKDSSSGKRQKYASITEGGIDWSKVESESFDEYRSNLQVLGLPKHIVDDILFMDISRQYTEMARGMDGSKEYEFWKNQNNFGGGMTPEKKKAVMDMYKQRNKLFEDLTGVSIDDYSEAIYGGYRTHQKKMNSFLSDDKLKIIMEMEREFNEKQQEIYVRADGMFTTFDQQDLEKIEEERRQKIKLMMTPDEWEQYQMRTSQTANNLRNLQGLDLSKEEFASLFKIQQPHDEKYNNNRFGRQQNLTPVQVQEQQKAQVELEQKMKETLGPERYEEYKMSQDYQYRPLYGIVKRLDLPKSVAIDAYKTVKQFENDLNTLQVNKNLDSTAKKVEYEKMKKSFQSKLNTMLTERGAESYLLQGGRNLMYRPF